MTLDLELPNWWYDARHY